MSRKHLLTQASTLALAAFVPATGTLAMVPDDAVGGGQTSPAPDRQTPTKKSAVKAKKSETPKDEPAAAAGPDTDIKPAKRRESEEKLQRDLVASDGDIIVRGVRTSLAKARDTKRKSTSIVDVVEAEDIGKLPNNTLGDVIASIPGISVTREEGEVSNIQVRGLNEVQTTIGGTPIQSGIGRTASIQDMPADLVASVEVYKTRSPDQVEGAGAGSINIVLRKPVDFKEGLTVSANANGRFNSQARRWNTTYTGIANYRRNTGIGDVGAMLGLTINSNPVLESAAWNYDLAAVQNRQVVGPQLLPQPTFAPGGIAFRYNDGTRTTPSVNGALQWSPDGDTSVALEGNYSKAKFNFFTNWLELPTLFGTSSNTIPELSNIVLVPGTNRIASATVSPVTKFGPRSWNQKMTNDNLLLKLTGNRSTSVYDLSGEIAYYSGKQDFEEITIFNQFANRPVYDVEFASDKFRYPMMNAQFRNLDLLDPNQYRFNAATQFAFKWHNYGIATRADVTLRTFWDPIEYLKFGMRFADNHNSRRQGGRGYGGLEIPAADMPEGFNKLVPIAEGFAGTGVENNARWLTYDGYAVRNNFEALRQKLATLSPSFATRDIPMDDGQVFDGRERTVAAYGTIGYRTKLLLPIDGIVGARVTNTMVDNSVLVFSIRQGLVNGTLQTIRDRQVQTGRGNYLNIEPTATAVIHFTPSLQTRLSWNIGIRRPNIDQLRSLVTNDEVAEGRGYAIGGNPNLKPETTTRYDAIIEYYFGNVGLITVNPYYWKTQGAFADFWTFETLERSGVIQSVPVRRPYNSGNGYRRGVELQGQMFFRFLPGILKNFGVAANYTYVEGELNFTKIPNAVTEAPATVPLVGLAKNTYNIAGLFERGTLNARVSYNYNGAILLDIRNPIQNSAYLAPRNWLDIAVNYSIPSGPLKDLGFSLQVQNALASVRRAYYGYPDQPQAIVYMARTYGATLRYRF